jgi:hypothetical protein
MKIRPFSSVILFIEGILYIIPHERNEDEFIK